MTLPESPKRKNDNKKPYRRPFLLALLVIAMGVSGLLWWSHVQPQTDLPTARLIYPDMSRLISLNLQTGERTELQFSEYHHQKMSPDGKWIAYWNDINLCCDSLLDVHSTDTTIRGKSLGVFYGSSGSVSWTPDSQWIAYSATPQEEDYYNTEDPSIWGIPEEIYLENIYTYETKRLTENGHTDRYPAVSPDGTRIAYTSDADGTNRLYIMDVATRESHLLTPEQDGYKPVWSPDGQWLAFISNCQPSSSEALCSDADLWIIRADGTQSQSIMIGTDAIEAFWLP